MTPVFPAKLARAGRYAAAIWFGACSPAGISAVQAQTLSAPSEVVLYIHSAMKRTEFVERLECALKHVLVAPVSTRELKLALGNDLRASPTQFDTQKVASAFARATANDGGSRTFKFLFLPFDLKEAALPFVFNSSFTNTQATIHVGVMSTARLDARNSNYPDEQNSAQTAYRLYKLILKSLVRLAAFKSSDSCVLAPLRNLEELDRQSTEFCPNDRTALVEAAILKPEQDVGIACALMSFQSSPSLNLLASRQQALNPRQTRAVCH
jgi:predicted Zn-dependent protease